MAPDKDPQLERLNAQLHDGGCVPEHDLWPGIDKAITDEESRLLKRGPEQGKGFGRPQILLVAAAVVTFAMILIPLKFSPDKNRGMALEEQFVMDGTMALGQSERTLTLAMSKLENAVRENPDDPNLLRLVRMVSSRQGELLRCKWTGNNRVQNLLDGGIS